jgi:hypothetical protein
MVEAVTRRTLLRGMLGGTVATVGIPLLDCFLNENGTAMANGAPIPARFGTWFWGMGMHKKLFNPDKTGPDYDVKEELGPIEPLKRHINIFSNFLVPTDDRPNIVHMTGWVAMRCGAVPKDGQDRPGPSIDVIVGDHVGGGTRFPSLEMSASGGKDQSLSFRGARALNPSEVSPTAFYQRVFGPQFQDPNSSDFRPDPELMLRKSVLSAVREDAMRLQRQVGAADRARLDEHFTALRGLEQRLALQLQRPEPVRDFRVPPPPAEVPTVGEDVDIIAERHRLMTDILVMALLSNQTRVFNMYYALGTSTTKKGLSSTHHLLTHEESLSARGVQEMHSWFVRQAMESWAYFVGALAAQREGARSLLDNTLVFAHSEHEWAQTHAVTSGIPMMTAGRAGGRIKAGIHIDGGNRLLSSQVGLTLMQVMGVERSEWGGGSMRTKKTVGEVFT